MVSLGIFCNGFFNEPKLANLRPYRIEGNDVVEVNLLLSCDDMTRDYEEKAEHEKALNWVWMKDGTCMERAVHDKLYSAYDWIMFVDSQDEIYWDSIYNNVIPLLKGSGIEIVHCFPSLVNDCFGCIKHLSTRKFPGNLYSWIKTEHPLSHFIFAKEMLLKCNGRIAPNKVQMHSFFAGLLMHKPYFLNHGYPIGSTNIDAHQQIYDRGLWLLKKEWNHKISNYSSITKEALGFPVPHRLTRKIVMI